MLGVIWSNSNCWYGEILTQSTCWPDIHLFYTSSTAITLKEHMKCNYSILFYWIPKCSAPVTRVSTYPVNSEICSKRSGGSSSPSSCLSCTCSCTGGSASWLQWRCDTRPAPPDPAPRWSCSPGPPRTVSSCGTWCCRWAPGDTARWPLRSQCGRAGPARCCRHPSRWAAGLEEKQTHASPQWLRLSQWCAKNSANFLRNAAPRTILCEF